MSLARLLDLSCLAVAVLFSAGCSVVVNAHSQKEELMTGYLAGQREQALQELEYKLREPAWYNSSVVNTGDEIMWRLEAGALDCIMAHDDECIAHFERAEALIEEFDDRAIVSLRDIGAESAVLVTNLNALPYRGWCRDRIMIPVYKSFAYLGKGDEDGFKVELNRLRVNQDKVLADYRKFFDEEEAALQKQERENKEAASSVEPDKIMRNPRNRELNKTLRGTELVAHRGFADFFNPFAIFLSAYGYARADDYQNAIVDFERLYKAMPNNSSVRRYYVTCLRRIDREVPEHLSGIKDFDFDIGENHVLVIFANGRSGALKQSSLYIPIVLPGYATVVGVAWPVCEFYKAPFGALRVKAGGRNFRTFKIADMDGILAAEYNRRLPMMIVRICLSTAVKEVGSYVATRAASEVHEIAGVLTAIGTATYKVLVNTADTRGWEILPKEFQMVQFAMPSERSITVSPDGSRQIPIELPPEAGSAIVMVNAPGNDPAALSFRVFSLKN